MKIICIDGNYKNNGPNPTYPLFTVKPETCILRNNHPFFIPDHALHISPQLHLVLKISRLGKNIQEKFAYNYFNEIGIGLDLCPLDLLETSRNKGLPWDTAKCFDFSSPLGNFIPISPHIDLKNISFSLKVNDQLIAETNTSEMIFGFGKIIEHVSKYIMLKMGDLIYTGSPKIPNILKIDDHVEAFISDKKMLWFNVK